MNVLRENLFRSFCASDGKFLSFSSHEFFSGGVVESWGAGIQVKSLFFQTGLPSPSPPPKGTSPGQPSIAPVGPNEDWSITESNR